MPEESPIAIPSRLPVMVLPCTLFPRCLMPLFIFEQRYREMLKATLETDRFFCVGSRISEEDSDDDSGDVAEISTAGIVRACVTHDDGTSHLLLLGAQRIRFTGWEQTHPYRIATVEPVDCETDDPELADRLANEVIEMTHELVSDGGAMSSQVHDHLRTLDDPSSIADVIAHSFVTEPRDRQILLETLEVGERLHRLSQFIRAKITDQS